MINKFLAIKHIYPDIKNNEFNVSWVEGAETTKITKWAYNKPIPTDAQLNAAWKELSNTKPPAHLTEKQQIDVLMQEVEMLKLLLEKNGIR